MPSWNSNRIFDRPTNGREISSSVFGLTRRTRLYIHCTCSPSLPRAFSPLCSQFFSSSIHLSLSSSVCISFSLLFTFSIPRPPIHLYSSIFIPHSPYLFCLCWSAATSKTWNKSDVDFEEENAVSFSGDRGVTQSAGETRIPMTCTVEQREGGKQGWDRSKRRTLMLIYTQKEKNRGGRGRPSTVDHWDVEH